MNEDYYKAPSDEIFNEIKEKSIEIWQTYDDTYGYASEKINRVKSINNVKDNWGAIVGMFDNPNQQKLLAKLSPEAQAQVRRWL
jgi:hypothetical protein